MCDTAIIIIIITRVAWLWDKKCQKVFEELKARMASAEVLVH